MTHYGERIEKTARLLKDIILAHISQANLGSSDIARLVLPNILMLFHI